MCRVAGETGHISHDDQTCVKVGSASENHPLFSTVGMDNLSLWKNHVESGVKHLLRNMVAGYLPFKSLFIMCYTSFIDFLVFSNSNDALGISLRMNKEPPENRLTNNIIIFSFSIYLLWKRRTMKVREP